MHKLYNELARYWQLVSAPQDYAEEADFFLAQFAGITARPGATLLELGSGGGNNAFYLKRHFAAVTLVDLSPQMQQVSQQFNPDCEHLIGDMRTVRLERTFDAVFIHDAIDYMTTPGDLRQALETAFIHCKPGGLALLVPDHVRETFEPGTDHGGEDGDGRAVRYLEWSHPPAADATSYFTDYVVMVREGDRITQVTHDRHVLGLFPLALWLGLLAEVGFQAHAVLDSFERHVFVAHRQ